MRMNMQNLEILKKMLCMCFVGVILISIIPIICSATEESEDKMKVMVSLGDSYSSGESIEPYYGQDETTSEKVKNPDWIAHRSKDSWPGMLSLPSVKGKMADNRKKNWFFVAASGAVTDNIKYSFTKEYSKGEYKGEYNLVPQLDVFNEIEEGEVDYVTLTFGGNDAGFADIITTCVVNGEMSFWNPNALSDKLKYTWQRFFVSGGIRDRLNDAYNDIAGKAGPQAHIIVAGYPKLLNPEGGGMISGDEAVTVNKNVSKFNDAIESIVNNCRGNGLNISFVSVENEFEGHGAYSNDAYITGIVLGARGEDLKDFMLASESSVHPNKKGACAYARCVQAKIDELENIESSVTCNTKFQLSVYDKNDYLYGNYDIKIEGKEFSDIFKFGLSKKDYAKTITVDAAKKVEINLPQGDYTITVTDGANAQLSSKKEIKIRSKSKNDSLSFRTGFGETVEQDERDINVKTNISDERSVVLTLDVSGSMAGTPLDETKKASEKFINTVLKEDAGIGVVTYDDASNIASGFSDDEASLQSIVSELSDGGGTNIEAGLRDAQWMLEKTNSKKKIIVLMSDGEPNEGLVGEDLIEYADEIKKSGTIIYTIGFFNSLVVKSNSQYLMESIASDGCHYEVASADDLVFFFGDMADQINGQKYIYVRIACPVDIAVTHDGETLDSSEENLSERTTFGTLTFEENREYLDEGESPDENEDNRVKVLRLKEGVDYDLEIKGTGRGTMNYTIGFMDDNGDYSDLRKFKDVKITRKTKIDTVASHTDKTTLNIDEDGDGKYDLRLRAGVNGYGQEVSLLDWIYYVIIGMVVFTLIDIFLIIIYVKRKKNKRRNEE